MSTAFVFDSGAPPRPYMPSPSYRPPEDRPAPYLRVPDRLLRAYAHDPLAVGVYVAVARCALAERGAVPLSPADLAAWSGAGRVRDLGLMRRIARLIADGWLIATRGRAVKLTLLPTWGVDAGAPLGWVWDQPQLGKPVRLRTRRVPLALLDSYLGYLLPQPGRRAALISCCFEHPLLDLADLGAYCLCQLTPVPATPRLHALGLVVDGQPLPPPPLTELLRQAFSGALRLPATPEPTPVRLSSAGWRHLRTDLLPVPLAPNGSPNGSCNGSPNGSCAPTPAEPPFAASPCVESPLAAAPPAHAWDSWESWDESTNPPPRARAIGGGGGTLLCDEVIAPPQPDDRRPTTDDRRPTAHTNSTNDTADEWQATSNVQGATGDEQSRASAPAHADRVEGDDQRWLARESTSTGCAGAGAQGRDTCAAVGAAALDPAVAAGHQALNPYRPILPGEWQELARLQQIHGAAALLIWQARAARAARAPARGLTPGYYVACAARDAQVVPVPSNAADQPSCPAGPAPLAQPVALVQPIAPAMPTPPPLDLDPACAAALRAMGVRNLRGMVGVPLALIHAWQAALAHPALAQRFRDPVAFAASQLAAHQPPPDPADLDRWHGAAAPLDLIAPTVVDADAHAALVARTRALAPPGTDPLDLAIILDALTQGATDAEALRMLATLQEEADDA